MTSPLSLLLEGERTWGGLQTTGGRHGITRHRLEVYPPGLNRGDRIAIRLRRTFSIWGLGLWLLIEVPLMVVLTPWEAIAAATVTCLIIGVVVTARAARVPGDVHTLTAVVVTAAPTADATACQREVQALSERLLRADAGLAAGELTPLDHEAEVWRVYDRIAQPSRSECGA